MRLLLLLGIVLAGASCSNDNPGPNPPEEDPYLRVTVTPALATMSLSVNAVFQIAVTRGGLYQGAVTLTAEGLPASLTANFQPSPLVGFADRSTLTVTGGVGLTTGNYTFVVRARGPDVEDAVSAQITVVVTP